MSSYKENEDLHLRVHLKEKRIALYDAGRSFYTDWPEFIQLQIPCHGSAVCI